MKDSYRGGYGASLSCFEPGHAEPERLLVDHALGDVHSPYKCDAIAYRLASPAADHYFLTNDGPERNVRLETPAFQYKALMDAVSGEGLANEDCIALPAHSGRWLRAVRGSPITDKRLKVQRR